jgi:hypothetical protein
MKYVAPLTEVEIQTLHEMHRYVRDYRVNGAEWRGFQ